MTLLLCYVSSSGFRNDNEEKLYRELTSRYNNKVYYIKSNSLKSIFTPLL
jgi:hypothetical protein